MVKLTSPIMLTSGFWLLFAAHALAAGHQGTHYSWESTPASLLSLNDTKNIDHQVMTGHTGARDKGKAKESGSSRHHQDAHNPPSSPPSYPEAFSPSSFFVEELDGGYYDEGRSQQTQGDLTRDPSLKDLHATLSHEGPSIVGGWNNQLADHQSPASKAWPDQHNDVYSDIPSWSHDQNVQPMTPLQPWGAQNNEAQPHQHSSGYPPSLHAPWPDRRPNQHATNTPWSDDDPEQHLPHSQTTGQHAGNLSFGFLQADGVEKLKRTRPQYNFNYASDNIRDYWQAFNRMLTQNFKKAVEGAFFQNSAIEDYIASMPMGALYNAPSTWYISVVDNPFGPIEDRDMFKKAPLHDFVSIWANDKRKQLALGRGSDVLDFMRLDRSTRKWIMKENYKKTPETCKITTLPSLWFPKDAEWTPVQEFLHQKELAKKRLERKKAAKQRLRGH